MAHSSSIAIDLGTSNTLISETGRGIVFQAPSAITVDQRTPGLPRYLCAGDDALSMAGREPTGCQVIWPLRDGVICDGQAAAQMLRLFLKQALPGQQKFLDAVISLPIGATGVERRAFYNVMMDLGCKSISLVYEPVAAAIGSHLDPLRNRGTLIVDVGSGITEIALLSCGSVVASESIRVGGNAIDLAIIDYLRNEHKLLVGRRTAELLKIDAGRGIMARTGIDGTARGKCLLSGLPRQVQVQSTELRPLFMGVVNMICDASIKVLQRVPSELVSDILADHVWITGGGLLIPGLERALEQQLQVRCRHVQAPLTAVAMGNLMAIRDGAIRNAITIPA